MIIDSIVIKITQELWQLASVGFVWHWKQFHLSSSCFHAWLNMTKFVNNSLFGKNKAIKIAKRLSAIFFVDVQICRLRVISVEAW